MAALGLGPFRERQKALGLCGLTESRSGEMSRWRNPLVSYTVLMKSLSGNAHICKLTSAHCDRTHIETELRHLKNAFCGCVNARFEPRTPCNVALRCLSDASQFLRSYERPVLRRPIKQI